MATASPNRLVTYKEWLEMPSTHEGREEVADGVIVQMPPNKEPHGIVIDGLYRALIIVLPRREFRIMISWFGVVIRTQPLTSRAPDITVYRKATATIENGYLHSAPELVVEVLSPSNTRKEMRRRLQDYADLGVPEVWVASPETETVEVLHLREGRYESLGHKREGSITLVAVPEVHVSLDEVWDE